LPDAMPDATMSSIKDNRQTTPIPIAYRSIDRDKQTHTL